MPDNGIALERREAQGSRAEGPRAPGPPPPSSTWVPEARRVTPADRKAGEGSLASSLAPPGAPSPHVEGRRKMGCEPAPGSKDKQQGRRSVGYDGCLTIESGHCPQVGIMPIGVEVQQGPKLPPFH